MNSVNENNKPLVSIAVTTYNGEKYLRKQLDSLLAQDYENYEILVADDCSQDSTLSILQEYSEKSNLKFYQNSKNLGYIKNFEAVIGRCKGDYIALCDQDDIWYSNKLTVTVEQLIKDGALLCYCDADLINEDGALIGVNLLSHSRIGPILGGDYRKFYFLNTINGCTAVIDRDLYVKALPFPEMPHDWWLAYLASYSSRMSFVSGRYMGYRMHSNNTVGISYRVNKKNIVDYIKYKFDKYSKKHIESKLVRPVRWNRECVARFHALSEYEKSQQANTEILDTLRVWMASKINGGDLSQFKPFFEQQAELLGIKLRPLLFQTERYELFRAKVKLAHALLVPVLIIGLLVGGLCALLLR